METTQEVHFEKNSKACCHWEGGKRWHSAAKSSTLGPMCARAEKSMQTELTYNHNQDSPLLTHPSIN